jgi:thiol:disulfide interchange protein
MHQTRILALTAGIALAVTATHSQFIATNGQSRSTAKTEAVQYLAPEQVTVPAGKPSAVTLHFRIAPGLHVNSNKPHDEFLIPTVFSIPDGSGVKLAAANYPQGHDITLPADPKTKLNVYTGDFTIDARLVATAGNHMVQAKLRYQACDNSQCMPPKTITVAVNVVGK